VSAPSAADGSGAGDSTASRPGPGAGAGEPTDRGGRGVGVPTPGGGGSGAGASGDGPLALAIPGDGGAGVYGPYLTALRRRLLESLEYPMAARRRGLSGTVHLEIAIDATGRLSEVLVVRSSSHALLDDAALQAARSLRRVPFPPNVRPRPLRVLMPVVFDLR
jgi:protein TonB